MKRQTIPSELEPLAAYFKDDPEGLAWGLLRAVADDMNLDEEWTGHYVETAARIAEGLAPDCDSRVFAWALEWGGRFGDRTRRKERTLRAVKYMKENAALDGCATWGTAALFGAETMCELGDGAAALSLLGEYISWCAGKTVPTWEYGITEESSDTVARIHAAVKAGASAHDAGLMLERVTCELEPALKAAEKLRDEANGRREAVSV
ncbi:MAG: hypothetical protein AMXMBFR7_26680 [Planctomycetota bacterium]